jgi:hypothetical protein
VIAALLTLPCASPVLAANEEVRGHVGFVDGTALIDLAFEDEGSDFREIEISGPLLQALSRKLLNENEEVGRLLSEIVSINAVIVEGLSEPYREQARKLSFDLMRRLDAQGWDRAARVREKRERVGVYLRYDEDDAVVGLTVVASQDAELVFVNIAGRIDVTKLSELSSTMGLPGLDAAQEAIEE